MLSLNLSPAVVLPEINRCFDLFILFIYLQEEGEILKKGFSGDRPRPCGI